MIDGQAVHGNIGRRIAVRRLTVGLVALALVGAACSSSKKSTASSSPPTTATSTGSSSGSPFNVAIVADMTGAAAQIEGQSAANGAETALDSINAANGAGGHQIKFEVEDAQSSATGAVSAFQQAASAHPNAIIVATETSETAAMIATMKTVGVPVVGASAIDTLYFPPLPWFYGLTSSDGQLYQYYIQEAKQLSGGSLAGKRIAVEGLSSSGVDLLFNQIQTLLKAAGATIVNTERAPLPLLSYASQAQNTVAAKPDIVITIDAGVNTVVIVKALRTAGFTGPVLGAEGASDNTTFSTLKDPTYYADRIANTPAAGDTMATAAQKYGFATAGSYFGIGWSDAYIISATLARCGSPCSTSSFESSIQALGSYTVPGDALFGPVVFNADRHYGRTQDQFFSWNSAQSQATPAGQPVDVTNGADPTS